MALTPQDLVAEARQHIREVDVPQALALLPTVRVLDVREPAEFAEIRLPGAISIPRGVLEFRIGDHPAFQGNKDQTILVYCRSGARSALAAHALTRIGYSGAISLAGGITAWLQQGAPTDTA